MELLWRNLKKCIRKNGFLLGFLVCFVAALPVAAEPLHAMYGEGFRVFLDETEYLLYGEVLKPDYTPRYVMAVAGGQNEEEFVLSMSLCDEDTDIGGEGNEAYNRGMEELQETEEEYVVVSTVPEEEEREEEPVPADPETFFKDTLFIGDSRTVGLAEYSDLGPADVFAGTGLSVYRLYKMQNSLPDQKSNLQDILNDRSYDKIYFMLGINELGYNYDQIMAKYEEELVRLMEAQPDAEIYLEANLHVTDAKSRKEKVFTNEAINRVNDGIRQLADKYGCRYIDINTLFDDENGALSPEMTHDAVHILAKYYQGWADWIMDQG